MKHSTYKAVLEMREDLRASLGKLKNRDEGTAIYLFPDDLEALDEIVNYVHQAIDHQAAHDKMVEEWKKAETVRVVKRLSEDIDFCKRNSPTGDPVLAISLTPHDQEMLERHVTIMMGYTVQFDLTKDNNVWCGCQLRSANDDPISGVHIISSTKPKKKGDIEKHEMLGGKIKGTRKVYI